MLIVPNGWFPESTVGSDVYARIVMSAYPLKMLETGANGDVHFQLALNQSGEVEKSIVTHATPPGAFELSAFQAVKLLLCDPQELTRCSRKIVSNNTLRVEGI